MRALCPIRKKIWHPSRTLWMQDLQNESAVFNSEEDLAPLSHFTGPGAPECKRCAQFGSRFGTPLALYKPRSYRMRTLCLILKAFGTPLSLYGPRNSRMKRCVQFGRIFGTPLALYGPRSSRMRALCSIRPPEGHQACWIFIINLQEGF